MDFLKANIKLTIIRNILLIMVGFNNIKRPKIIAITCQAKITPLLKSINLKRNVQIISTNTFKTIRKTSIKPFNYPHPFIMIVKIVAAVKLY
jgi:hypothetical protein